MKAKREKRGKHVLYYCVHALNTNNPYVVITYTDFTTRVVYSNEPGYKAAKARAMRANRC